MFNSCLSVQSLSKLLLRSVMLKASSYLKTHCPSPTTASYRVSDARPKDTLAECSIFYVSALIRALIGTACLAVLFTKLQCLYAIDRDASFECHTRYLPSDLGWWAWEQPWQIVMLACAIMLFLCLKRYYTGKILFLSRRLPSAISFTARVSEMGTDDLQRSRCSSSARSASRPRRLRAHT